MKRRIGFGIVLFGLLVVAGWRRRSCRSRSRPAANGGSPLVGQACPTFSWTAVDWASGYRVAVFEALGVRRVQCRLFQPQRHLQHLSRRVCRILQHRVFQHLPRNRSRKLQHDRREQHVRRRWRGLTNTTGTQNACLGYYSGGYNTTGSYNTFLGYKAGQYNTTASFNTFVGFSAGSFNTTGANNTFLGYQAGILHHHRLFQHFFSDTMPAAPTRPARTIPSSVFNPEKPTPTAI